ncbi:hypothetical protein NOM01_04605 [Sporolactobacillus sp. STSJ-5]|uniref:hypothetical protein n=1 Tax=Sporolactobacillus sp. STSJ-5 TaxID=2965076 RepID=UPI0021055691|nr:hypothetical protein [Sporolactobacillus sp. STSJ-5]MCQ2009275.1 hypothetical protein [Sporolactobacillus sp. STSJ-5]
MTAETSILNRHCVALAADSAVTVGTKGNQKAYNYANKIFALSKKYPIGIMIYGGAEFMSVPWETIIKVFRSQYGNQPENTVKEYCKKFVEFIEKDPRFWSDQAELEIVSRVFEELFGEILHDTEEKINFFINKRKSQPVPEQVEGWIIAELKNKYRSCLQRKLANSFSDDDYAAFEQKFSELIRTLLNRHMMIPLKEDTIVAIIRMIFAFISRDCYTNSSSGLVITGYGEQEIFPKLYEYSIEGFILKKLKLEEKSTVAVGSHVSTDFCTAAIKPFAQSEMAYSFISGIEPRLKYNYFRVLNETFSEYMNALKGMLEITDKKFETVKKSGQKFLKNFSFGINQIQQQYYINPLINIVTILPKEEVAEMAEALVNLTSFKRRVSIDLETVGGPIDVALITKGDGFVWIKRKHYFDPNLNHNFFKNY